MNELITYKINTTVFLILQTRTLRWERFRNFLRFSKQVEGRGRICNEAVSVLGIRVWPWSYSCSFHCLSVLPLLIKAASSIFSGATTSLTRGVINILAHTEIANAFWKLSISKLLVKLALIPIKGLLNLASLQNCERAIEIPLEWSVLNGIPRWAPASQSLWCLRR